MHCNPATIRYNNTNIHKGVAIEDMSWGRRLLGGVCNKNATLRRGFKKITKIWRGHETETSYISKLYK